MSAVNVTEAQMQKTFTRFDPPSTVSREEAETHYTEVHTRFARRLLRATPGRTSYVTYKVRRQLDINGRWLQRPRAWRFVSQLVERPDDSSSAHDSSSLTAEDRATLAADHPNCLMNLRRCLVTERVAFDARVGQPSSDALIIEYERDGSESPGRARERMGAAVEMLVSELGRPDIGGRLVIVNSVDAESETLPVVDPGQLLTDRIGPSTMVGFVEIYVDHIDWLDEVVLDSNFRSVVLNSSFHRTGMYEVERRIGFDRRWPTGAQRVQPIPTGSGNSAI